jgi:NAD(P)-dependent dehydrogenase (short-subunit alcohol dehydrogenase family)
MRTAERKRTAVVTGASSGIGHASVSRLVNLGWTVFAGVRKTPDSDRLQAEFGSRVIPVIMDVTDQSTIRAASERLTSELKEAGLSGLVNVAGIGKVRPVEYATPEDLRNIFDINVFGQVAVTQAFLPLLRKARGRIVNISSVGAHIAIPFGGLLNASKAAFGLLSDNMRLELRPFGIRVSTIEPGAITTPAVDKTLGDIQHVIDTLPVTGKTDYGAMMKIFAQRAYAREIHGSSPDVVAQAVEHALTAARPRIRYRVGKHARLLTTLPRVLPDWALDELILRITGLPVKFGAEVRPRSVTQMRGQKVQPAI